MTGKEQWRKNVNSLDLDRFTKGMILWGLREIHHKGDHMDGRMDTCLGYSAILGAELSSSIKELANDMLEEQKKRSFDSWERMDVKRQLEDQILEGQKEITDLKGQVDSLEALVEKLTHPPRSPSPIPPFHPGIGYRSTSPIPDIGFPEDFPPPMEIPGLMVNQQVVDEFLDWTSYDRSWPHGGYEVDAEGEVETSSNKENEWVTVPLDE